MKKRIRTLLFFIMALCCFTEVSAGTITFPFAYTRTVVSTLGDYFCNDAPYYTGRPSGTGAHYRLLAVGGSTDIPTGATNINTQINFNKKADEFYPSRTVKLDFYDAQSINDNCDAAFFESYKNGTYDGSVTFDVKQSVFKTFSLGSRLPNYVWVLCEDESQWFSMMGVDLSFSITYTLPGEIPSPTGLTLKSYSCNTLNVGWNAVSGATSYAVYLNGVPKFTTSTNSATLSGLTTGTDYYIEVEAITPAGRSSKSAPFGATPTLPTTLTLNTDLSASSKLGVASQEVVLDPGFDFVGTATKTFEAYISTSCPASKLAVIRESDLTEEVDNGQSDKASKSAEVTNSCFPNPTHGEFTVRMDLPEHQTSEIRVYDSMGKLVKSVVASATETLVSIEDQPAGIYFVRYTVDGKDQSAKVVKL